MPTNNNSRKRLTFSRAGQVLAMTSLALILGGAQLSALSEPAARKPTLATVLQEAKNQPAAPADLKQSLSKTNGKYAHALAQFDLDFTRDQIWGALTNYSEYPNIFHRIKTCVVTRRVGDRVWIESELKPHFFVRRSFNRTYNDLSAKPQRLDWQLLEGNFTDVRGYWELEPAEGNRCHVKYMLEVDPGPVVPAFLVSFVLKFVQKEVIGELTAFLKKQPSGDAGAQSASATTRPPS